MGWGAMPLGVGSGVGGCNSDRHSPVSTRWTVQPYRRRKTNARNEVTQSVLSLGSITEQVSQTACTDLGGMVSEANAQGNAWDMPPETTTVGR